MQLFVAIQLLVLALFLVKEGVAGIERAVLRPPVRHHLDVD
ncbi:MAG TPA: hypothetical protein VME42_20425 [Steroidobacteraceae bacterium]|nr:hypothetical protein [Steroidobacteraceae bacterium]